MWRRRNFRGGSVSVKIVSPTTSMKPCGTQSRANARTQLMIMVPMSTTKYSSST